jgi:pilus assembly protein TadC
MVVRESFYKKVSFLKNSEFLNNYEQYLIQINLKVDPVFWIIISSVIAGLFAGLTFFVLELFEVTSYMIIMVFVVLIVVADLMIGYPYIKGLQRIGEIEKDLPEALKQMADILKAGGTYEYALREISTSDFGPLTKEIQNVLRKLEEGENFENSLMVLSRNVNSRLVKRSVTIIIDSVKAGAGLADILDEIAEDIRLTNRIQQERKSRTLMQVLFMVAAGALVTPFIYGLVSTILNYMISSTAALGGTTTPETVQKALENKGFLIMLVQIYILIEIVATSVMIALMRDGNKNKSIIYLPALLFIAFIVFFIASAVTGNLIKALV